MRVLELACIRGDHEVCENFPGGNFRENVVMASQTSRHKPGCMSVWFTEWYRDRVVEWVMEGEWA